MDFNNEIPLEFFVMKPFNLTISGNFDDLYYFVYDVFYASGRATTLGDFIIKRVNPDSTLELKIKGALFRKLHEEE